MDTARREAGTTSIELQGKKLDCGYRLDIVAYNSVLIEVKAVEKVLPIHSAQVLTYLTLTGIRLGLLINFNVDVLRSGIYRIINESHALCVLRASVVMLLLEATHALG